TVPTRGSALSGALAALSRGSARQAGDLLPGGGRRRRAAEPSRKHGRGVAAQGQSGRLFPVLGRAAWLPKGRQHSTLPRRGTRVLCGRSVPDRPHVLTPLPVQQVTNVERVIAGKCSRFRLDF